MNKLVKLTFTPKMIQLTGRIAANKHQYLDKYLLDRILGSN